jgi:hypothetical protein
MRERGLAGFERRFFTGFNSMALLYLKEDFSLP